ncbi:MAG: aminoacetone oxidase family FAD-binding enzyme [Clostridia bacterium]
MQSNTGNESRGNKMRVVVIGGGAAGMMAAITAAKENNNVKLLEKTSSLGNKVKITGKGRCNLTFEGTNENFKENIVKNYKFMYSSFSKFDNKDVVSYFNSIGVKTKVERGGRVFPISESAEEIVIALKKELKKYNVEIIKDSRVKKVLAINDKVCGVELTGGKTISCDKCIVATGGKSYQKTGSTGDGYDISRKLGHKIVDVKPGLVPLKSNDIICKNLQGLSLKNVELRLYEKCNPKSKIIYYGFGEMLFAHFGMTGPMLLSSSSKLSRVENIDEKIKKNQIYASIDLKPALSKDILDKRLCRDFEKYANKEFKNSLDSLLPQKLIPEIIKLSGINKDKKVHQITKKERMQLLESIKNIQINISGFMPLEMAIITTGGIDVSQINPKTMESKIVTGLYFAGEVIDVDAYTGGYNLQIAFSTAVAAGKNKKEEEK